MRPPCCLNTYWQADKNIDRNNRIINISWASTRTSISPSKTSHQPRLSVTFVPTQYFSQMTNTTWFPDGSSRKNWSRSLRKIRLLAAWSQCVRPGRAHTTNRSPPDSHSLAPVTPAAEAAPTLPSLSLSLSCKIWYDWYDFQISSIGVRRPDGQKDVIYFLKGIAQGVDCTGRWTGEVKILSWVKIGPQILSWLVKFLGPKIGYPIV